MIRAMRSSLVLALAAAPLLAGVPLHAQQEALTQTLPGGSGQQAATNLGQTESNSPANPGPVGGVENYRLETPGLGRSFIVPRIGLQEVYATNPGYAATTAASQADEVGSVSVGLTVQWVRPHSALSLDYGGEGLIYRSDTPLDGTVQLIDVAEKVVLRRWNLLFGESFGYSPNSLFGLGGLSLTGGGNLNYTGIAPVTSFSALSLPAQTIGSPRVSRVSSASDFEAQYTAGKNSSVSGSVVFGLLHFFGSDLLNSRVINARLGYDYELTRRDTISLNYQASILQYPSGISGFTSHSILPGYRRILSGHFLFLAQGGVLILHFTPFSGQTTVPGGTNEVTWTVSSSLSYQASRSSINLSYSHGANGGSGFFVGSLADSVSGNISYRMSRNWSASLHGAYNRNTSFQQTTPTQLTSSPFAFNGWSAGMDLSRNLGRYAAFQFNYQAFHQSATTTTCVNGITCGPIALTQIAGVSLHWSTRPHAL